MNLSSTNPSSTTDIYYSKISVGVQIEGIFQSESVFLQSRLQTPHERTLWTAVVAISKTNGSLGMIDGLMKAGDIVAHVNILGKLGILKNSFTRYMSYFERPESSSFQTLSSHLESMTNVFFYVFTNTRDFPGLRPGYSYNLLLI